MSDKGRVDVGGGDMTWSIHMLDGGGYEIRDQYGDTVGKFANTEAAAVHHCMALKGLALGKQVGVYKRDAKTEGYLNKLGVTYDYESVPKRDIKTEDHKGGGDGGP